MDKSPHIRNNDIKFVKELISEGEGWNMNELRKHFYGASVEKIIRNPVSIIRREDKFIWLFRSDGKYTIKTGYHRPLSLHCCSAYEQSRRGLEPKFNAAIQP
ncbi:hypothetical protein Ahy_B06g080542 [Arachis hypogaea]|uniref:Uncharacterized protein n=1 Tax=Arachis hypogaea TaxID=3818 RepID=A0A444YI84_ARAHY|nr:hypothetical protein Ahy_B06g080542 [Arachis hypogaea]